MKKVLHVFLLMLLPACLLGQSFPFTQFTLRDGLPHNNVYAIAEDASGYLWLGTENGLVRFDGTSFVSFFSEQALARGLVTALQFSDDGILYAGTHDNKVFRIGEKQITNLRSGSDPVLAVNSLGIQKGHVFVFHEFSNLNVISEKPAPKNEVTFNVLSVPYCSRMMNDGTIITGKMNGLFRIRDGVESNWVPAGFAGETIYSVFEDGEDIFLGSNGVILQIRNEKVIARYPVPTGTGKYIKMLVRDRYHNFWFGFFGDENFYVMTPDGRVYNLFESSGAGKGIVGSVHRDSNGSIWISILGQGLYRFSASMLRNTIPDNSGKQVTITCTAFASEKYLVFGTHNGLMFYDKENNYLSPFKLDDELLEFVRDVEVKGNTVYVCITDIRLTGFQKKEKTVIVGADTFRVVYRHASSVAIHQEGVLLGNWDNRILYESAGREVSAMHVDKRFSQRVNCLDTDNSGNLYAGTPTALIVFNEGRNKKFTFRHPVLDASVNRISKLPGGEMMITTDNGVVVMREMKVVRSYDRIGRNRITAVAETGNGITYIATTNGLYRITSNDTVRLGTDQGLPAGQISQLLTDTIRNELIIITSNRFSQVSLSALQNYRSAPPAVLISGTQTSEKMVHFRGPVVIPFNEQLKLLTFSSLGSLESGQMIRLVDDEDKEHFIFNGTFDLSELSPGTHRLSICFINDDGTRGNPTLVTVELTPPFYRTSLFYLISGVSGAGMVFAGWRKRKRSAEQKKLEKEQLDYKMNLLKQQALVSNLNPHFIFNALNAIQAFINSDQQGKANEYLALFAKLMRQQLNTAGKDLIPLSEELERLQNYLEIETLRFGDRLEYSIETDERFNMHEPSIPNMIIQPFLENAIWHGFKGMKEKGTIRLSILLNNSDELIIRIEDNGRGMDHSFMNRQQGKDPRGISLIRERLELMDDKGKQPLTFSELDPSAIMPGTVVTIVLSPKMYRIIT